MPASDALATINMTRKFGKLTAVSNLNLNVQQGDIYGFLGPNGAGKTTAIRGILGLLPLDQGEVRIFGESDPVRRRMNIGALVERPKFHDHLSARENLRLHNSLRGGKNHDVENALDQVGLIEQAHKSPGAFSTGMKQRLGLARAMLGKPKLLILDEPTDGLDPSWRKKIQDLLFFLVENQNMTVFLSSHLLTEVEKRCNRVGIIDKGVLQYEGELSSLQKERKKHIVRHREPDVLLKALEEIPQVSGISRIERGQFSISLDGWESAQLNAALHEKGVHLSALIPEHNTLEQAFLRITEEE